MKKMILITLIALTSAACPSKDKNNGSTQGVIHPNNISNTCMNSYYNPQTGQYTTYNPYNGTVVSNQNVGFNQNQYNCNGFPGGGFGNNGFYPVNGYSTGWGNGFGCGGGYIAVYGMSYGVGCLQASYLSSYYNALVYSYSFGYGNSSLSWSYAGFYGGNWNQYGNYSAVIACYDNSFCNCAKLNGSWGVCVQ